MRVPCHCIKTGFNLKVGEAVYRADLHMDGNRLYAAVNRYALEGEHQADVTCTSYHYDVTRWPNYELDPAHCTFTRDFFRTLCRINPELSVVDFIGITIE